MGKSDSLLERDDELAAIGALLDAASGGDGGILLVEGEAGAGKTSLLDEAGRHATELEMQVLRARGGEFERDFPYGVVRQLFDPARGNRDRNGDLFQGSEFGVLERVYWRLADLAAERPLAILIDDLQWADLASLHALLYIVRRLEGVAAGFVVSVRTGEPGPQEALLRRLRSEPAAEVVSPRPLSEEAVAEVVASRLGREPSARFAAACHRSGAGNPFFVVELARAVATEGIAPDDTSVERLDAIGAAGAGRSILSRLGRLGDAAGEAARAVAILEPNASLDHVAALAGMDGDRVASACSELIEAQLLADGMPLAFVHPLVRHAVYADIPEPRRALLHAASARRLDQAGASVDTVAAHLLLATPAGEGEVVTTLREAASIAMGRGASASAVEYLRRALREPPRDEDRLTIRRELATALLRGDDAEGLEVLASVRSELSDPVERAEVTAEMIGGLGGRGRAEEAAADFEQAMGELGADAGETRSTLQGLALMLPVLGLEGVPAGAMPSGDDLPIATIGERVVLDGAGLLLAFGLGRVERGYRLAKRSVVDRRTFLADAEAGLPHHRVRLTMTLADRGDGVGDLHQETTEASRRRGSLNGVAQGHGTRAACLALDGNLVEAAADAELAVTLTRQTGHSAALAIWVAVAAIILIQRGELDAAEALLARDFADADRVRGLPGAQLLIRRGDLHLLRMRPAQARDDYLAAAERIAWLPFANPEMLGWRTGLARAEAALGNSQEAQRIAEEAVACAREAGGSRGIGIALATRGIVGGPEGIEDLREAAGILGGTRARLRHAEALIELGAALRRGNRRRDAREPLRQGLDIAHRSGAALLQERARTELDASGARPRGAVLSGVESLTPSELRTARMAAGGMTNREIAQQLFVTAKTVETHLRHAFQKLEISKRTELGSALGDGS